MKKYSHLLPFEWLLSNKISKKSDINKSCELFAFLHFPLKNV